MQPIVVPFNTSAVKKKEDQLWDPVRKMWVSFAPEEWVRQIWLQFWIQQGIPVSRMSVEKGLLVNDQHRRTDVVVYDSHHRPWLLLECKAPTIALNQKVFDQAARYNMTLKVPFLLISNGHYTFGASIDIANQSYQPLTTLPEIDS